MSLRMKMCIVGSILFGILINACSSVINDWDTVTSSNGEGGNSASSAPEKPNDISQAGVSLENTQWINCGCDRNCALFERRGKRISWLQQLFGKLFNQGEQNRDYFH